MNSLAQINNPILPGHLGDANARNTPGVVLGDVLRNFLTTALGIAGVVFFVMLLWGGFDYLTAGGDKDAVAKAGKKITTAITGIVIIFSVFALAYILDVVFGINIINLRIPTLG